MSTETELADQTIGHLNREISQLHDQLRELRAERNELAQNLAIALGQRDDLATNNATLLAERNCLLERLRQSPDMRYVIGELRRILNRGCYATDVKDLLRRLDESQ